MKLLRPCAVVAALLITSLPVAPAEAAPEGEIHGLFRTSTGELADAPAQLFRLNAEGAWTLVDTAYFGTYEWTGLRDGTYRLYLFRDGEQTELWWPHARERALAGDIEVADGASVTIRATTQVGATIQGTISGPHGQELMDRGVNAFRETSAGTWARVPFYDDQSEVDIHGVEMSDRHGDYHLRGLLPGRYKVFFGRTYRQSHLRDEWWSDVRRASRARILKIHRGELVTAVDARLERR